MTEDQIRQIESDGVVRVYIDYFQEVGEGRKYKG